MKGSVVLTQKSVVLIIRDGWGENHNEQHDTFNAVKIAKTPVEDRIREKYPRTEILACGLSVGLPEGIMGNSEVGHQNLGAGRGVDQEIVRINKGLSENTLDDNLVFNQAVEKVKKSGGKLHYMGLVSDAGVHSMLSHLYAMLKVAQDKGLSEVFIHAFTDGRDTPPDSGLRFIKGLEEEAANIGIGTIATVCGRFWSMDRDNRWERVQKAYDCITGRKTDNTAKSAQEAIEEYYGNPAGDSQKGDEFIPPTTIVDADGQPLACIEDGDAVVFFNFRGDRPREITRALIDDDFDSFDRGEKLDIYYATMTEYQKGLCPNVLFTKPPKMKDILGSYLSDKGLAQFRCAETEKYPHVTFFFNDYREEPFLGEDRKFIPSPKDVTTYDEKPEMSARGVCDATKEAILSEKYSLIVVNFANPDMVGHTGVKSAVIEACEFVDKCVGELLNAVEQTGNIALITSDHGNSDQLWDPSVDGPHTAHTLNPVEVIIVGEGCESLKLRDSGQLGDVAPTILKLMGLEQPDSMTGQCLIV